MISMPKATKSTRKFKMSHAKSHHAGPVKISDAKHWNAPLTALAVLDRPSAIDLVTHVDLACCPDTSIIVVLCQNSRIDILHPPEDAGRAP
jgi:hypothetical protein